MNGKTTNVLNRHDTFLGVCEAIGQDFGFNPNYLRAILSLILLFSPVLILGLYFGLGLVIACSRWLYPPRREQPSETVAQPAASSHGANDTGMIEVREAA